MIKEEERSLELDGPPIKKRRMLDPHQTNHSECNKEPNLLSPKEPPATLSPADISNQEVVVKQDDPFNNGKESLMEGSQIDCSDLEQESHTNKDKIEMEASVDQEVVVKQDDLFNNGKESLMEVSQIDCSDLEQESHTNKDKIEMEASVDQEVGVKQDDLFNNGKESLTEGSQIDCSDLEQESHTNKVKIEMEASVETSNGSLPIDKPHINTESKMDVIHSEESASQVKNEDNGHSGSRKKLLVLDVNGLLVDIVADPDETYRPDTIIGSKAVFKRPYCDEFLKFCFERFNVGVWTSRTRRNIERVLDFLIKDTQHQLLFCWDQAHCTETGFNTIENSDKPLVLKELKKLWEKQDPDLPWDKGDYNESNTFLLDDSPYKALRNPPYTAIFPYTYSYRRTRDNGLGPKGDLRVYLERLAESDNVQKFIEQNPFGQQPITLNNKSWKFYLKVIGATSSEFISSSRKKLLVLDINGLLTDVAKLPIRGYTADLIQGNRAVFKRPYCEEFLKFCFEKFNVGIWSSTNRRNTEGVLDFLMRDTQHQLYFCWDQYDCTDTGFGTVENINKPLILKELKKLWEKKDPNLPWDRGDYDASNTLLLENSPSKALLNPRHTAIFPSPYRFWKTDDNYLGPEGELRVYLERLAESENVQKFVEENPFGQRPLSCRNLSWGYYQKVMRAMSSKSEAETLIASYLPPKLEPETVTAAPPKLEPESDTNAASVSETVSKSEADNVADSAAPINLEQETETNSIMSSGLPNKLEPESDINADSVSETLLKPEADNVTDLAAPIKLEQETNSIMGSDLPNKLEPESDTNADTVSEAVSKSEADNVTDSATPIKLEQETEINNILSSDLQIKLEQEADITTGETLLDLPPANDKISLETVNNG